MDDKRSMGPIPLLTMLILAVLPVFYTWGRLPIWGDTIIPFNSMGLMKYAYQWISWQNGLYYEINYFPYYLFFRFCELFTRDIYLISAILLFALKLIAGTGIYRLARLLYGNGRDFLYALPVAFYLLSPAQLNASYYLYVYALAPWFLCSIFKIIKHKKVDIEDLIWMSALLFVSAINLPNPKYIFHLFVISAVIISSGLFLGLIDGAFMRRNVWKSGVLVLLSAYLIVPQLVFVSYYSPQKYDVHVKAGYKDSGSMMDFGEATLDRMFKLHKDTLNLNEAARNRYKSSAIINALSYLFVILILAGAVFVQNCTSEHKKYRYVLLLLMAIYLFFAAGPNPPLGPLYQWFIERFPLLAFLRTTAGATLFLSIFYALSLFPAVLDRESHQNQNVLFAFLMIGSCIVGHPFLTGEFYKNVRVMSPNTDTTAHGIKIPNDYFDVKEPLDSIKIDAKVLYTRPEFSYIATDWGYFGVPIYDFIYPTDNLDCRYINNPLLYNIGFIYTDKSGEKQDCPIATNEDGIVKKTSLIEISRFRRDLFLPHFYTPERIIRASGSPEDIPEIIADKYFRPRSAILLDEQNRNLDLSSLEDRSSGEVGGAAVTGEKNPVLEFKRIDPTKYRVVVHGAAKNVLLVFNENFHAGWKIYLTSHKKSLVSVTGVGFGTVDASNAGDQATADEIKEFVDRGLLTRLNTGRNAVDFVSKEFSGTIQNDNLSSGHFWETWIKKSVSEEKHISVNGYANGWIIEPDALCRRNPSACVKNGDGTRDFELIVEFFPQKTFYISVLVSGMTLCACLLYLLWHSTFGGKKMETETLNSEQILSC